MCELNLSTKVKLNFLGGILTIPKSSLRFMPSLIIGHGSTFHDPAICLASDNFLYAEALERHTQCKRGMTSSLFYSDRALVKALSNEGYFTDGNSQLTYVSSWDPEQMHMPREEELQPKDPRGFINALMDIQFQLMPITRRQATRILGEKNNSNPFPVDRLATEKYVKHHLTHAANAVFTSPFDECVVMVVDGQGENSACDFYHFKDNNFHSIYSPSTGPQDSCEDSFAKSPGFTYAVVTRFCGFDHQKGEEWKVMGLAAYGKFRPELYNFFMERSSVKNLDMRFDFFDEATVSKLRELCGGFRLASDPDIMKSADLAHNFQKCFETRLVEMTKNLGALGLSENLAFAGGCALNSSANGKLLRGTGFKRLHVPCAPADDGNALGAALYEKYVVQGQKRKAKTLPAYLGSYPNLEDMDRILPLSGLSYVKVNNEAELCTQVADLLAEGKIIGWMQGRAEFGPRALGNRSIIADPRPADMKDRINSRVKFREEYRPLAPSILHECGEEYFEDYTESPYMERALIFKESVRKKVPAVVHEDGTGRLQTVKEEWNPLYYNLIKRFYEKTGVPIVLNTSFNVMGKPIIHTVEDAITVFSTSGLDVLVIDKYIIQKKYL